MLTKKIKYDNKYQITLKKISDYYIITSKKAI